MDFCDKALQLLHGEPLLKYGISLARPQVESLIISANHSTELYQSFGLPVVADQHASYSGPLLGIYSAMHWFLHEQANPDIQYLACFAADVPVFPADLIQNLAAALSSSTSGVAYTVHNEQIQPLFSLWRLSLADTLLDAIGSGLYGPKLLFQSLEAVAVTHTNDAPGAFFNINSHAELAVASRLIATS